MGSGCPTRKRGSGNRQRLGPQDGTGSRLELGVAPEVVLERLRRRGLQARADEPLREVALRYQLQPSELAEIIRGGE